MDRSKLTAAQRIEIRGYEADASLAESRAAKHRKAGRDLQASIQDEIAIQNRRLVIAVLTLYAGSWERGACR